MCQEIQGNIKIEKLLRKNRKIEKLSLTSGVGGGVVGSGEVGNGVTGAGVVGSGVGKGVGGNVTGLSEGLGVGESEAGEFVVVEKIGGVPFCVLPGVGG